MSSERPTVAVWCRTAPAQGLYDEQARSFIKQSRARFDATNKLRAGEPEWDVLYQEFNVWANQAMYHGNEWYTKETWEELLRQEGQLEKRRLDIGSGAWRPQPSAGLSLQEKLAIAGLVVGALALLSRGGA